MQRRGAILAAMTLYACGPRPSAVATSAPATSPDEIPLEEAAPRAVPKPTPLTHGDCLILVNHLLAVGMADQRARKPTDHVPTDEQVTVIREQLAREQLAPCLAMPREQWTCALAAASMLDLYACADAAPTPSVR